MLTVEFHCHTIYSKDSLAHPKTLLRACQRKRIDRLVITDHNTIAGALAAKAIDPERVIVGEEIMTQAGELLAAFVSEEIPRDLPPLEAISRLRQQGAFISVSHPFDTLRSGGWALPALLEIIPLIDAIEVFNSRCTLARFNQQAQSFAQQKGLPGTVGSDAHAAFEVGRAVLELPVFTNAASLKIALRQARYRTRLSSPWVHFVSSYAKWYKRRHSLRSSTG
jgi:hypothetical protein